MSVSTSYSSPLRLRRNHSIASGTMNSSKGPGRCSPDSLYAILCDESICRQDRHVLLLALCDKNAIKWVTVEQRQGVELKCMVEVDRQHLKRVQGNMPGY